MMLDANFNQTKYASQVKARSNLQFALGFFPRLLRYLRNSFILSVARKNGADVGINVVMPYLLARRANANLIVGNNTSIQTGLIDLRAKVHIGSNVIIGQNVEIITCSHNVDSEEWEHKEYGLVIDDYVWLATNCTILPSVRRVSFGAVVGASAVVTKDIGSMNIVAGNPAIFVRERKCVHSKLVVPSLLGGDFCHYIKARNTDV